MGVLPARVSLLDIDDVEAFAVGTVRRLGLVLDRDEGEDLEAFALCELYALERRYNPAVGKFRGYARRYLKGRVLDEWHRQHRGEHVRRAGSRAFDYRPPPVSLDELLTLPGCRAVRPVGRFERAELAAA